MRPRLPRMTRSDFGILCVVALVVLLASVLIAGISTRATTSRVLQGVERQQDESAEQRGLHRQANQSDHNQIRADLDCLLRFAVHLGDPARDRNVPPDLPAGCDLTVAADEVNKSTLEPTNEEPK